MDECTAKPLNNILYLLECRDEDGHAKKAVLTYYALRKFTDQYGLRVEIVKV